jgi:hypothetical protein
MGLETKIGMVPREPMNMKFSKGKPRERESQE